MSSKNPSPFSLPNYAMMQSGIDLCTFDPTILKAGYRGQVLDFDDQKVEHRTVLTTNYTCPACLSLNPGTASSASQQTSECFSSYDVQQSLKASLSMTADDPEEGFACSLATSVSTFSSTIGRYSSSSVSASVLSVYFTLTNDYLSSKHVQPLAESFKKALLALPLPYNDTNQQAYFNFFNVFGTHVIQRADFGGAGQQIYTITSSERETYYSENVDVQTSANEIFTASIGLTSNISSSGGHTVSDLHQFTSITGVGGVPAALEQTTQPGGSSFDAWTNTIMTSPVPVSGIKLTSFTTLLANSQGISTEIITALEAALPDYYLSRTTATLPGDLLMQYRPVGAAIAPSAVYLTSGISKHIAALNESGSNLVGLTNGTHDTLSFAMVDPTQLCGQQTGAGKSGNVKVGDPVALVWANYAVMRDLVPTLAAPYVLTLDEGTLKLEPVDGAVSDGQTWQICSPYASVVVQPGQTESPGQPYLLVNTTNGQQIALKADYPGITTLAYNTNAAPPVSSEAFLYFEADPNWAPAALTFDGSGATWGALKLPSTLTALTIRASVMPSANGGDDQKILAAYSGGQGFTFGLGVVEGDPSSRSLYVEVFPNGQRCTWQVGSVPVGQWAQLELDWDGDEETLTGKINGVQLNPPPTGSPKGSIKVPSSALIGGLEVNGSTINYAFSGQISALEVVAHLSPTVVESGLWTLLGSATTQSGGSCSFSNINGGKLGEISVISPSGQGEIWTPISTSPSSTS